ncbi:unnamed protein product [Rotaria sp. Silwood1]|nr:unnamed protein product [Rotaria sp. Silwood1]CAF0932488.1 unnamed protein product [Rotaria sp. Silwood1]CAF3366811.1 unnamed protein product [Rotaria sp. Silwood1]CAF3367177.1 unnamed protein product [Rotaria sp. Silwood1]CAF3414932.1 unnamed protein product [Rotaria sp. Silwood1]
MSIIRYRFKADKNFESVKIDGMNCSLGELKRLIAAKSSRSGTYYPKDDYDLIISNANTHEEYKDNSDLIPRNASVIVARRIRGTVDTLTPFSNQKPVVSSDDIVKDILRPAILNQSQTVTTTSASSNVETNSTLLKKNSESTSNASSKELTEDELIKEIQMGSQARYVTSQQPYRTNLFVCHNCKQPGHIKNQCPLILSSNSISTGNASGSSSSANDGTSSTNSGSNRSSGSHSSHIVTRHAPYPMSYHHRGNRSHRGAGHPRGEPLPKKTTGIPRDRLIPVPKHIPGALRDQSGASVVPRQMAELYVERIEKKTDSSGQIGRQTDEKGVSSSISSSSKSTDNELPPNDLLCPLCKQVYTDAVITPCCNLSFCDACIRTALIESSEHECPHCHCQHVAIDQINPNLYLRNHIKRWHERQNQSSFSQILMSQHPTQTLDQDIDTTPTNLSNTDEYEPPILSTNSQQSSAPIKTAPIIIKMQPLAKSQSPQPIVSTRPADMTFEDEKISDIDQTTSSQKDVKTIEETTDTISSSITPETEKPERETTSTQVVPVNTIYSSPSLAPTIAPTNPVVPHYYPVPQHHNVVYPHHIPPTTSNGLYPIQPNYYPPPVAVRYPAGGMHHYPPYAPAPPIHHHPLPPPPPPIVAPPHIPTNGYNMPGFHPHSAAPYTSTSTFIAHHQTATQPISTALSENEFYIKQRYFQRIQRSPSRRSRSSSYSSYSSSDSRSSSRSRYNRRRRSSRSRSRHRVKSPVRDNRRQRRSSSYRNRRRPIETKEKPSTKYRRTPPRPARDHERRRSPRPPPTIQQSTQRTIVYLQESSHSSRDRRRTKSRSRENDDRISSSSKKEQQPQSESKTSSVSSPIKTTLSSKIETVVEETLEKVQEDNSKNGKKHKKHKKHRHSSSKSKKRHRSKDKEKKTIVDTTTSVIEIHS